MKNVMNPNQALAFNADVILVSVSGGKDSAALIQYAVNNFPKEKLVLVHAKIDIDWKETIGVVEAQAAHYGLPLKVVCAVDSKKKEKGFISHLVAPRRNRETGVIGENQFPSMDSRWCTSILKTGPIDKLARSYKNKNVLVLIGERREESPNRAKLEAWRPDDRNSKGGRVVVKCSPILDMTEADVWATINFHEIPTHPCYSWGVSRASCAICIFSSNHEIALAAQYAPEIVAKYVEAEAKISHTFRYKAATKKTAEMKLTVRQILEAQNVTVPAIA